MESSTQEPLEGRLLQVLQHQLSVVQVLHRSNDGAWSVRHVQGVPPTLPADAVMSDADLPRALAWVSHVDRARIAQALQAVALNAVPWHGDAGLASDEDVRWARIEIVREPLDAGGGLLIVTARDTTAAKQLEMHQARTREHWTLACAAAELGILEFDIAQRRFQLDAIAVGQHGLLSMPVMTLEAWLELFVADDRVAAHALLSGTVLPDETETLNLRLAGPRGTLARLLALSFRKSADSLRLVGACRDVTEHRALQDMRRKTVAAEKASKSKSEFMSHLSHELRTPLNGILGFAQLMALDSARPLPDEQHKRLEIVLYSARRLLGLIDKLLEISRIESGKHAMRLQSVNVAGIVRVCMEQIQPLADEQGITLLLEVDNADIASVQADAGALEQVLTNLLSNAVKYNRPKGRVRVSFRLDEAGTIDVDDTGHGMSEAEVGRLFEPFTRLSATAAKVPGHGLGLVITRQLVEAMHGELHVASMPGVGSRFSVSLPLARPSADLATTSLSLDLPSQWDTGRRYDVLYIEDDEVNTVLMQEIFRTQPEWTLTAVATGTQGIAEAVREHPQVVLIDLNLPDMTGHEVMKRLKSDRRTRDIPCVAVSADAMTAQVRSALDAGFDDYWTKPLDLPDVVARLKRLLR